MYALYKTVWEISQKKLIEHAAARGPFIDQSQSLNLFLDINKIPEDKRIATLSAMYMMLWEKGLKSSYYLRGKPATKIAKTTVQATEAKSDNGGDANPPEPEVCESCQ
jgi:ribonucleoside-diphosphate reductase alpha chain